MFSTFITVVLFVFLVIQGASAGFAINSPRLVQCEPAEVSWAAAFPPYKLEIVPAFNACEAPALGTIGDLHSTRLNYTPTFAAGTRVVFFILDSEGNDAWSGTITVEPSTNNSCVPGVSAVSTPSNDTTAVASPSYAGYATPSAVSSSSSSSSSTANSLGGAINAEPDPLGSAAFSVCPVSTPLLSITALAAMFAQTL